MLAPAPPPPRSPWQRFYSGVLARRAARLARAADRLPVPVISIGNLAWGGAGKTPFTRALAEGLVDRGRRVAILSRGYGRTSTGPLFVCRGEGPEVELDRAGDEPFELARALPDVPIVVAELRIEGGRLALAELRPRPDLFLLDDGFSHAALARDIDLLLFPAADPWSRGRLLPSGRLREPLAAAARADAAILTSASEEADGTELAAALRPYGFRGEGFASATEVEGARRVDGEPLAAGTPVYAVAAIARPESFFAAARAASLRLVGTESLRDHASYPDARVRAIDSAARAAGAAAVLTTGKDRAKLEGRLALPLATLPIVARPEERFWSWLEQRLEALDGSRAGERG